MTAIELARYLLELENVNRDVIMGELNGMKKPVDDLLLIGETQVLLISKVKETNND